MNTAPNKKNTNPIVLRKGDNIGNADAESDTEYLDDCYYVTENLYTLLDCKKPQRIVLGRTGSGKTALLNKIAESANNVIQLSLEDLSFNYISNSTIINFFEEIGVDLGMFYTLLWRHIFCVELIKKKYGINNEQNKRFFREKIQNILAKDDVKKKALEYVESWGDKFWETTEERVKVLGSKFESSLNSSISGKSRCLEAQLGSKLALTEEQRSELINHGKEVVNKIQIRELGDVMKLLADDIFNDPKEKFYILIDNLDSAWINDKRRARVIKSLIETIKKFQMIPNVKIIVSIRYDLLQRVLRETKDAGFQEEKMEALYLRLNWNVVDIEKILDLRVNGLFKKKYNNDKIGIRDLLTKETKNKNDPLGYILERTFLRPREAIQFINLCMEHADGRAEITYTQIHKAEMAYSQKRINSLADEWGSDYPLLETYVSILHRRSKNFNYRDFLNTNIDDILLKAACANDDTCSQDRICNLSKPYVQGSNFDKDVIYNEILSAFYMLGIIGIKFASGLPVQWSYISEPLLKINQVKPESVIQIHPTFWMALGVAQ